jgi:hypothetical protein
MQTHESPAPDGRRVAALSTSTTESVAYFVGNLIDDANELELEFLEEDSDETESILERMRDSAISALEILRDRASCPECNGNGGTRRPHPDGARTVAGSYLWYKDCQTCDLPPKPVRDWK